MMLCFFFLMNLIFSGILRFGKEEEDLLF
jgi:hypothetical protein